MSYQLNSFKDLLNEIAWSWEYPNYNLIKTEGGNYSLNKLYITPERATYKTDTWEITEEIFKDVERFYEFLQSTERK